MAYKNIEKKRRTRRLWELKNRKKIQERKNIYNRKHPEIRLKYGIKFRMKNPNYMREYLKKFYKKPINIIKRKCRYILNREVKKGNIIRPEFCSKCSSDKKIEAHHEDYSKPLEVIWLCKICHESLDYLQKQTQP